MSDFMMSDYDPRLLAEMVGQQYNPSQGYPLKQVSDQMWDVYGPTPDYLIAQQFGMMYPNRNKFNLDSFFAAAPELRGPFAQAYAAGKGDIINTYAQLQSPEMRKQMAKQIGQNEWDQIAATGDLRMLAADNAKERDAAAIDYYQRGIEDLMAQGAPTSQRNMQAYDYIAQRQGGLPTPGAGQYPSYGGGGQGSGGGGYGGGNSDPLARIAGRSGRIDLNATPQGTAFGEGLQDVGAATGKDRLEYQGTQRFAVLGGRKFALPDTMEGPHGGNPAYTRALNAVVSQNRAERAPAARQRAQSIEDDKKRAGFAKLWKTVQGMGTLVGR